MNENLKNDLEAMICAGNIAKLPTTTLNDYNTLKTILTKACGKYKKNVFEFPYPAQAIINRLLTGESIDFKKEFQFFATPPELAQIMFNQTVYLKENMNVLEPSAGHGALIDVVKENRPSAKITACELSELNFEVLKDKYKNTEVELIKGDFLETKLKPEYDLILANPPFSKNQDIDHVKKMYSLLADDGQLITIMSKSWTFDQQKKQVDFKNWIDEVGALVIENGQGSFKTSGTNVDSVLVVIYK